MDNKRLYIDFHVIQTVPPSCVNRDDTGRPKTAIYGGVNRARVSSQSWKHSMRKMFNDIFSDEKLGFRTKHSVKLIADALKKLRPDMSDENAEKAAADTLEIIELDVKKNTNDENVTSALFFISIHQAEKLAEVVSNAVDKKEEIQSYNKKKKNAYIKKYKEECDQALMSSQPVDIALFGRMLAGNDGVRVDAASQVAHSISTHAVQNEYDYFTAVDDCSSEDNAGAGHLGTMEFNSATLYRYATVNVTDLLKTIGEDTADAIRGFADAFICSMPTGKQNSYANRTLPDMVYVTIRSDQPVNLCGAFEKPVSGSQGYSEMSVSRLLDYAEKVYADYCGNPEKSYIIGSTSVLGADKVNFKQLLDMLHKYITDEVM